tara:strand:- start:4839 stop:5021 length:183 start_codon:yes stop_codon:yes gene_type:complete
MNPYVEIAKRHLSIEQLQSILDEKKGNLKTMSYEQQRTAYYAEEFKKLYKSKMRKRTVAI